MSKKVDIEQLEALRDQMNKNFEDLMLSKRMKSPNSRKQQSPLMSGKSDEPVDPDSPDSIKKKPD